MAARDYKNSTGRTRKPAPAPGSWVSFISGLGVGLLVAFGVYLWSGHLRMPSTTPSAPPAPLLREEPATEPSAELPRPTFDFYKILPEMEVPIPDWQPDETGEVSPEDTPEQSAIAADSTAAAPLDQGTYLLQVGSFKAFEDADRVKATLALHGITASIQRVVINGQDVWYRVHIGPLSSEEEIRAIRVRLVENNMDSILLRIGDTTGDDDRP
ncbi:MAG: SPOR domain-containing protein [Gammaproteobacteria bacterium]